MRFLKYLLTLVTMGLLVSSCAQKESDGPETFLARVNGQAITGLDLEVAVERLVSRQQYPQFSETVEQKALESLVMMESLAQAAERDLNAEELAVIKAKVRQYQQELLAEIYIRRHGNVQVPSTEEITRYYEGNKALFGQKEVRQYGIVRAKQVPAQQKQAAVLAQLTDIKGNPDWSSLAPQSLQQGGLERVSGSTDTVNIRPELLRIIGRLQPGETSGVVYIDDKPQLIRVTQRFMKAPAPLAKVRSRIQKTLAARKLKEQIKQVSTALMAEAKIEYAQ